jgi:hypothetical protein
MFDSIVDLLQQTVFISVLNRKEDVDCAFAKWTVCRFFCFLQSSKALVMNRVKTRLENGTTTWSFNKVKE